MQMNMKTENMMKIGGAVMAVGTAAAVVAGAVKAKNNPKRKMRKLAKKSVKAVDGVLDNMHYMFK